MPLSDFISDEADLWQRALVMAHLSEIAYDTDSSRRQTRFADMGFEELRAIECSGAGLSGLEAYILRHEDDLVVAIRGSQETIDWFQNARARKRRFKGVRVHRGFARSAANFLSTFEDHVEDWRPFNRIWLTGHSLGGAVAQIIAFVLTKQDYDIALLISFGSPRAGGPLTWGKRVKRTGLDERIVRWVNNDDIVARLPFFAPGADPVPGASLSNAFWAHIGPQHYIDTETETVLLNDNRWLVGADSFSDHSLTGFGDEETSGYIRNICQYMPEASRNSLADGTTTSLADSIAHLNRIREEDLPSTIASFSEAYEMPPSLSVIGLHFR